MTVSAFVLQVLNTNATTTQLSVALFSIIQFILSLGFGWVLTRTVTKEEYEESAKRSAISAYRRITDIDRMVRKLQQKIERMSGDRAPNEYVALDVVNACIDNIGQTLQSSISDWADIIGDELQTLQKIEDLETEKVKIISEPPIRQPDRQQELLNRLEENINRLLSSLPPKLRYRDQSLQFDVVKAAKKLVESHKNENGLLLTGRWDSSFDLDPCVLEVGDRVHVAVDSVGKRCGALIVRDKEDKSIGVVLNRTGLSYDNFVHTIGFCFPEARFTAEIIDKKAHQTTDSGGSHSFSLRVLDTPTLTLIDGS